MGALNVGNVEDLLQGQGIDLNHETIHDPPRNRGTVLLEASSSLSDATAILAVFLELVYRWLGHDRNAMKAEGESGEPT